MDLRLELIRVIDEEGSLGLCKRLGITKGHALKIIRMLDLRPFGPASKHPKMTPLQRVSYRKAAFRAQQAVCRAVKRGQIINLKTEWIACTDCKTERANKYDHRDYALPFKVEPVCSSCNLTRGPASYSKLYSPEPQKERAA